MICAKIMHKKGSRTECSAALNMIACEKSAYLISDLPVISFG